MFNEARINSNLFTAGRENETKIRIERKIGTLRHEIEGLRKVNEKIMIQILVQINVINNGTEENIRTNK